MTCTCGNPDCSGVPGCEPIRRTLLAEAGLTDEQIQTIYNENVGIPGRDYKKTMPGPLGNKPVPPRTPST